MSDEQKIEYGEGVVTFKCPACTNTVTEPYNEEIAIAEFLRSHPGESFDPKNLVMLCEPCYKQQMEFFGRDTGTLQ